MTKQEASERYNIPVEILDEYESWGLCGEVKKVMGAWRYDDRDLERLSMIMTLHDSGFTNAEVETYMRLFLAGNPRKRSGCGYSIKNATVPWMKSTSRRNNWSGWTIFGTGCRPQKRTDLRRISS